MVTTVSNLPREKTQHSCELAACLVRTCPCARGGPGGRPRYSSKHVNMSRAGAASVGGEDFAACDIESEKRYSPGTHTHAHNTELHTR